MNDIKIDFNAANVADALLRGVIPEGVQSASDMAGAGFVFITRIEVDLDKRQVRFYRDNTYLATAGITGPLYPGSILNVNFDMGLPVRLT